MIRAAFTMIELIFAIVIISLTALSLPMMMQVSQNSAENSVTQESIYAAASIMLEVLSHPWDENSLNPNTTQSLERVVRIPGQNARFDTNTTIYRMGHIQQDLHRRFHEDNTSAFFNVSATLGNDTNATIGMDERGHGNQNIIGALGIDSYKDIGSYRVSVGSIGDPASPFNAANAYVFGLNDANNTRSNMRHIRVQMNDQNNVASVALDGYAANIGEVDYYSRIY